jgi:hypothetical protein
MKKIVIIVGLLGSATVAEAHHEEVVAAAPVLFATAHWAYAALCGAGFAALNYFGFRKE